VSAGLDDAALIGERLAGVRERIARACARAGRPPDEVTLIGVTKTHPASVAAAACAAGLLDIGENRVQEAAPKVAALRAAQARVRWHLVGHLQTNKAKDAVDLFDILHAVDSVQEPTKFGVPATEAAALAGAVGRLPHLDLLGLMTVAPQADDPEDVRPVFRQLRRLGGALGLRELSMGMTDDFEVAIEEGATMVRVGRAIFGDRTGIAREGIRRR
jgi:uncharacterized pyridoxal phosphate-containing UPF0001 family protein